MNRYNRSVLIVLYSAYAAPAFAQYQFTRIADYPVQPFQFLQNAPINALGRVAFMQSDNRTPQGVAGLRLSRLPSPPITLVSDGFADARAHSLDDAGRIAFVQDAVFVTDGINLEMIAEEPDDPETEYHSPVLNQHGTVAFAADADEDGNTALYIRRPGEELELFSDGMVDPIDFHSPPSLDEADHVAFSAYSFDTLTTDTYLFDGEKISLIYPLAAAPVVSRSGLITFSHLESGGSSAVLRGNESGDPPVLIAQSGGAFTHVLADDVNVAGLVLFRASHPDGGIAMYVSDGASTQRVAQTGDIILGRKIANLSRGSINDRGQIAFEAAFLDGSASVLRATPTPRSPAAQ